ncbi:MAG: LysM peptidoglycan-binding domain-containing protein [Flavobacteriales bacterium]|nr:LysM peptidoglycan-binding domain-containing protein [Flavobacteriales bacterium]
MTLRFSFVLALLLWTSFSFAQETRTVDGRTYTVHHVEAGQTLYAIARTYAVPVDALLAANPAASAGLSIGQELLVPKDAVVKKEVKAAPTMAKDGELVHTVAKKETLFGIARNYGVDVNVLLERNPEAQTGLREGMAIVVPVAGKVQGQPDAVTRPAVPENIVEHTVKQGETLYALGQLYGVAPEAIQKANGGLPEGLKAGSVVRIPLPPGAKAPVVPVPAIPNAGERITVTYLLPFSIARNDSVMALPKDEPRFYEATRIATQFWAGARIALDSLQRMGVNAEVRVVDMGDDARTWNTSLKKSELTGTDLFIGPFHRSAIEQLARTTSVPIVCPVPQSNKVILGNPTVSKVTPTRSDLVRHSGRFVGTRYARENIVLLCPDLPAEKEMQDQMARAVRDALAGQSARLRDSALVAKPGRRELGDLVSKLDANRLNVLLAPGEDVEYVTTLVSKLKPLASKYKFMLVGLETWQNMETVATNDLELLGFHFAAASFADPDDAAVQAFTRAFRERFRNDVDEYALLGFDVTLAYVKALSDGGPVGLMDRMANSAQSPLHMGFRMIRTGPENGYRNEYAVMLKQEDLRLVRVR